MQQLLSALAYYSFFIVRNFSIAIGPVLGGLLTNFLGFRSVFVFLLILSTMVIIVIIFLLPETLRTIAGDGSLRLHGIHQPLIRRLGKEPAYVVEPAEKIERKKLTLQTFTSPLKLLTQKDVLINLIFGGVVYTIWSMVTSSTTGLFKSQFGLSQILLGLAFIPNGKYLILEWIQIC
jgi:MFS family permease